MLSLGKKGGSHNKRLQGGGPGNSAGIRIRKLLIHLWETHLRAGDTEDWRLLARRDLPCPKNVMHLNPNHTQMLADWFTYLKAWQILTDVRKTWWCCPNPPTPKYYFSTGLKGINASKSPILGVEFSLVFFLWLHQYFFIPQLQVLFSAWKPSLLLIAEMRESSSSVWLWSFE